MSLLWTLLIVVILFFTNILTWVTAYRTGVGVGFTKGRIEACEVIQAQIEKQKHTCLH